MCVCVVYPVCGCVGGGGGGALWHNNQLLALVIFLYIQSCMLYVHYRRVCAFVEERETRMHCRQLVL